MRSSIFTPRYPRAPPFLNEYLIPLYPLRGGVRRNNGLTSFSALYLYLSLVDRLGERHDGVNGCPVLDDLVVDRLVAYQPAAELDHAGEGLVRDLAPGDVVLGLVAACPLRESVSGRTTQWLTRVSDIMTIVSSMSWLTPECPLTLMTAYAIGSLLLRSDRP